MVDGIIDIRELIDKSFKGVPNGVRIEKRTTTFGYRNIGMKPMKFQLTLKNRLAKNLVCLHCKLVLEMGLNRIDYCK